MDQLGQLGPSEGETSSEGQLFSLADSGTRRLSKYRTLGGKKLHKRSSMSCEAFSVKAGCIGAHLYAWPSLTGAE